MLNGKDLGAAIGEAIRMKVESGAVRSKAEIARHFGVRPPSLVDWVNKGSISKDKLPELWRFFSDVVGCDHWGMSEAEWPSGLSSTHGDSGKSIFPLANVEPGPAIRGSVPLISWVQAGAWCGIVGNFAPGDAEEWLPCPIAHGPRTFVLRVRGESMWNPHGRPSFQDGDLIFVDPDRDAIHGSMVVVRLDDEQEATFKQLVVEGSQRYLRAANPHWPNPILQVDGEATICGVVIFKGEKV